MPVDKPEDFFSVMSNPRFKPIKNYEDYLIYEDGRVYSIKSNKFLTPRWRYGRQRQLEDPYFTERGDYILYRIQDKNKSHYVHRLLAEAFIPNPNNYPWVDHLNGIKHDNRLKNLAWVTASINGKHEHATGLSPAPKQTEEMRKASRERLLGNNYGSKPTTVLDIHGNLIQHCKNLEEAKKLIQVDYVNTNRMRKDEFIVVNNQFKLIYTDIYLKNCEKYKIPKGFYIHPLLKEKYYYNPATEEVMNAAYRTLKSKCAMNGKSNNGYMLSGVSASGGQRGFTLQNLKNTFKKE